MTIKFTLEEGKHLEVDRSMKLKVKQDTPDDIRELLILKVKAYNEWIESLMGGEK